MRVVGSRRRMVHLAPFNDSGCAGVKPGTAFAREALVRSARKAGT